MKSPNILIKSLDSTETCAKIADFGTSQFVFRLLTKSLVENPVWQGTISGDREAYVSAPEMIQGKPYDYRVDTYSAGVIFWEIMTREKYFGNLSFISDIADRFVRSKQMYSLC